MSCYLCAWIQPRLFLQRYLQIVNGEHVRWVLLVWLIGAKGNLFNRKIMKEVPSQNGLNWNPKYIRSKGIGKMETIVLGIKKILLLKARHYYFGIVTGSVMLLWPRFLLHRSSLQSARELRHHVRPWSLFMWPQSLLHRPRPLLMTQVSIVMVLGPYISVTSGLY